MLFLQAQEYQ